LSAATIGRLKQVWSEEHLLWSKRDLSAKRCVYFWADGIHVGRRIIGATPEGKKELVGLIDGVRESANCIVARSRRRSLGQPSRQQNEKAREKSRAFIISAR
jgi:transposase-like protein